jgi:hypothetical protein
MWSYQVSTDGGATFGQQQSYNNTVFVTVTNGDATYVIVIRVFDIAGNSFTVSHTFKVTTISSGTTVTKLHAADVSLIRLTAPRLSNTGSRHAKPKGKRKPRPRTRAHKHTPSRSARKHGAPRKTTPRARHRPNRH